MLDPKRLRANPQEVAAQLVRRGYVFDLTTFETLESRRKSLQTETEALQATRNKSSKEIGLAKSKGEDATPLFEQVEKIKVQLAANEAALAALQAEFDDFLARLPNIPRPEVPDGKSEKTTSSCAASARRARSTSRSRTTPTSARPSARWTSPPPPRSPAAASWCCAAISPACTAR